MTWGAEVAHIMRKDVRELRWVVAGYVTVLALATANALGWFGSQHSIEGGMLLVVLMGMLLLASFVQADSPTRPDAFWAIHPHRPSAVMCAKLASAGAIIVVPALVGQYAALSVLAVSGSTTARLLAASAVLYAAWLLVALVIAAITPDIRTFILVLIGTPIPLVLLANLFVAGQPMSTAASRGTGTVGIVGALALLAVLYRTRDARRRTWIAAFTVVACTAYALVGAASADTADAAAISSPEHRPVLQFQMGRIEQRTGGVATVVIHVVVDSASAGERVAFAPTAVQFALPDGQRVTVSARIGELILVAPRVQVGNGISVSADEGPLGQVNSFIVQIPARRIPFDALASANMTIEGNIRLTATTIVGSMPFEPGASMVRSGTRIDVGRFRATPDTQVELHVRTTSKPGSPIWEIGGRNTFDVVLVDQSRRTARMLFPHGAHGMNGAMVLPGAAIQNEVMEWGTSQPGDGRSLPTPDRATVPTPDAPAFSAGTVGAAWLRSSRLTVVQWVPAGGYPLSATVRRAPASTGDVASARAAPPVLARAK